MSDNSNDNSSTDSEGDSRFKIQDFFYNKLTVVGGSIANSLVPQLTNAIDPETYIKLTVIGKYLQK